MVAAAAAGTAPAKRSASTSMIHHNRDPHRETEEHKEGDAGKIHIEDRKTQEGTNQNEGKTQRQKDRETERQRSRKTERQGDTGESETETQTDSETERHRHRETERKTQRRLEDRHTAHTEV